MPGLDAAENVFLGIAPSRLGFVSRSRMADAYRQLADSVGFDVPAGRPVASLSIARQQQVEILRAISRDARLIVMDEPSARLSAAETVKLHELIRGLAESGRSVLLISHFLKEVLDVADDVTVLRDGRVVRQGPTDDETEASLVKQMLGRELGSQFPERRPPADDAPIALRLQGISGPGVADVSLAVRAGEIVGLAGLVGAGRTELGRLIVGVARPTAGTIELSGRALRPASVRAARRRGLLMLPESRRDEGLVYLRSTRENVSLASLESLTRLGVVDRGRERAATDEMLERVGVTSPGDAPVRTLSGGNQQKLLFARAMMVRPAVLIADEPTRGVDVGAKRAIYELLADLAAQGMAILLISSEMEEILGMPHRVLAMRGGRIVAELRGDGIDEASVLNAIFETAPAQPAPA